MKNGHENLSQRCKQCAFTLVELMIVILISSVVLGAIYSTFLAQQKAYLSQEAVTDVQQNIRAAFNVISKEIRLAGYSDDFINSPAGTDCLTSPGICVGSDNDILAFTYIDTSKLSDNDDNDKDGGQDGADVGKSEKLVRVQYDLYGTDSLSLGRRTRCGDQLEPGLTNFGRAEGVAVNIAGLRFRYLVSDSSAADGFGRVDVVTTGNMRKIRGVEVTILAGVRSKNAGQWSTTTFSPPGGGTWSLEEGMVGRIFTSKVMCRNLGI